MKNSPQYQIEHGLSAENHPPEVDDHLESIQDNERALFREDVKATLCTMFDVHEKICSCTKLNIDINLKFGGAHEIFEKGFYGWADQVAEIAKRYVGKLANIARVQKPGWSIDDQARWARDCVAKFLDEWWLSSKPPRHSYGRIEVWFKYACDGRPDRIGLPWRAPAWASRERKRSRPDDLSERLTPEDTNNLLARRRWAVRNGCFENALDNGEREARSDLAMKSAPLTGTRFGSMPTEQSDAGDGDPAAVLARQVERKLQNPAANPTMSVKEACHAIGKSTSSIYRYVEENKLRWSGTRGRLTTKSVKRLIEMPDE